MVLINNIKWNVESLAINLLRHEKIVFNIIFKVLGKLINLVYMGVMFDNTLI